MAPETVLGEAVDGRADIYGLGCVAYFLLTGRPVFEGGDLIQLIARHLHHKPVAPSARAELPVPPAVDAVVLACLEKEPEDRPQGARGPAGMLAACPVEPWTEEQSREWWRVGGAA